MNLSGDVILSSVYYKDLGASAFTSKQIWVDKTRNRIIKFVSGTFGFGPVVLALYDFNMENEQIITYDTDDYQGQFRGSNNLQYYDEKSGTIYANIEISDSLTGDSSPSGFSGYFCKLVIDFNNVANTTINFLVQAVILGTTNTNLFFASEELDYYCFAVNSVFRKVRISTGLVIQTVNVTGSLSPVRFISFDPIKEIGFFVEGFGGDHNIVKIDFLNNTFEKSVNTNLQSRWSFNPLLRKINDSLFEMFYTVISENIFYHRIYDFDFNLIMDFPTSITINSGLNSCITERNSEIFILDNSRYFRKALPLQTTKHIPLFSGNEGLFLGKNIQLNTKIALDDI